MYVKTNKETTKATGEQNTPAHMIRWQNNFLRFDNEVKQFAARQRTKVCQATTEQPSSTA